MFSSDYFLACCSKKKFRINRYNIMNFASVYAYIAVEIIIYVYSIMGSVCSQNDGNRHRPQAQTAQ